MTCPRCFTGIARPLSLALVAVLAAGAAGPIATHAQPEYTRPPSPEGLLTPDDCVRIALENNLDLRLALDAAEGARGQENRVASLALERRYPDVDFTLGTRHR